MIVIGDFNIQTLRKKAIMKKKWGDTFEHVFYGWYGNFFEEIP